MLTEKNVTNKTSLNRNINFDFLNTINEAIKNALNGKFKTALTIEETGDATSLSRTRLYLEIKAKRLRVIHSGRRVLVPIEELQAFMQRLREEEK